MPRPRERMEKRLATSKTFLILRCAAHAVLDLRTIARPEGVMRSPVHKGPRMFQTYHDAVPCGLATPFPEPLIPSSAPAAPTTEVPSFLLPLKQSRHEPTRQVASIFGEFRSEGTTKLPH